MLLSFLFGHALSFLFVHWHFCLFCPSLCMIVFHCIFSFGCAAVFLICLLFLLLFVICFFVYDCISSWFVYFVIFWASCCLSYSSMVHFVYPIRRIVFCCIFCTWVFSFVVGSTQDELLIKNYLAQQHDGCDETVESVPGYMASR